MIDFLDLVVARRLREIYTGGIILVGFMEDMQTGRISIGTVAYEATLGGFRLVSVPYFMTVVACKPFPFRGTLSSPAGQILLAIAAYLSAAN